MKLNFLVAENDKYGSLKASLMIKVFLLSKWVVEDFLLLFSVLLHSLLIELDSYATSLCSSSISYSIQFSISFMIALALSSSFSASSFELRTSWTALGFSINSATKG